ncbi:MAG: response regulator [Anaerolineales bacterium]
MMDKPFALLIEDDRDVAALFRHVLDMAGYRSESVYDGLEAMKRLSNSQPDVVLLDLQLPGLSGVDILQKMRADERMKTIPVIVITAYAYVAKSLPIEPDLFLLKPVDIHDLSSLIQRLRDKKDKLREPPYDKVTHLYTESFFSVRLIFALERVKRMELERFGVMFADLHPFRNMQETLDEDVLNALLRKMADRFKSLLRPSDTLAWSEKGYFLSLFEEISTENIPAMIAKRVGQGLNDFLKLHEVGDGLRTQIGVIMCDDGYESVQQILDDIDFARAYVKNQPEVGHWVYSREELGQMRTATP